MKRKGIAYRRMFLSFLIVFSLPLCLAIVFYFYSDNVMAGQMERSNENLLRTIQSVCDQEVLFYQNILQKYAGVEEVRALGQLEETDGTEYIYLNPLQSKLIETFTSVRNFDGAGEEIFLYFPKIDKFCTTREYGLYRSTTYYNQTFSTQSQEREAFLDYLSQDTTFSAAIEDTSRWGQMLLLTRSCWRRLDDCSATVGIWIDTSVLSGRVASIDWQYGFQWLILNEDGQIIKSALEIPEEDFNLEAYTRDSKYVVGTLDSSCVGWKYVLLVPQSTVRQFTRPIKLFFLGSLLLSVLIGFFVTRKTIAVNYAPLEGLLKSFDKNGSGTTHKKDEYRFLDQQISALLTSRSDMQATLSRNTTAMHKWVLINLLVKPYTDDSQAKRYLPQLAQGENIVFLLKDRVPPTQEALYDSAERQKKESDLRMFAIDNIFSEKIGECFDCCLVELDGYQVMIVNDRDLVKKEDQLWVTIYDLQALIRDKLDFTVTVASGAIHASFAGIHESYLQAREADEFIQVLEQDAITYGEVCDRTRREYNYSIQTEERIVAALQNDNANLALAFIEKAIEQNFIENRISPNLRRCILNDIYCTLLKAADEKGCIERVPLLQGAFDISLPVEKLVQSFGGIIETICSGEQKETVNTDKELCQRVLAYVKQNYSSPDLNISQTALAFHVAPSVLSATYKRETGKSLLRVINEIRIEHAVEYLQQGYSVAVTAEKVGITESSSFIRLFKKHMGMTPGQMRAYYTDK